MASNNKYLDLIKGSNATGVELLLQNSDSIMAYSVALKKTKDLVEITDQSTAIFSFENLIEKLNKKTPVYLSIDGKGIVHKSVKCTDNSPEEISKIATQYFPNYSDNDFYTQLVRIDENQAHLTLARKELINTLIDKFTINGIFVMDVFLGPFSLNLIAPIIENNQKVALNLYELNLKNGNIESITKLDESTENKSYSVDSDRVLNSHLVAYSCALNHYSTGVLDLVSTIEPETRTNFYYNNAFRIVGFGSIILIFIVLLINYLLFEHYNTQLSRNETKYSHYKSLKEELDKLTKSVSTKEVFFSEKRLLEASRLSLYLDQISCQLPQSISLNELNIHPLEKNFNYDNEVLFKPRLIIVKGETINTNDLNTWINYLKTTQWVKELNLINLQQSDDKSHTAFTLEIVRK